MPPLTRRFRRFHAAYATSRCAAAHDDFREYELNFKLLLCIRRCGARAGRRYYDTRELCGRAERRSRRISAMMGQSGLRFHIYTGVSLPQYYDFDATSADCHGTRRYIIDILSCFCHIYLISAAPRALISRRAHSDLASMLIYAPLHYDRNILRRH